MKSILGIALLCVGLVFGQEQQKPFTKEEVLLRLKPVPGKRSEQGDLAGEIEKRGIAFKADEATLAELRKAGARTFVIDAIQQAEKDANRPRLLPNTPAEILSNASSDAKAPVKLTTNSGNTLDEHLSTRASLVSCSGKPIRCQKPTRSPTSCGAMKFWSWI